MKKLDSGNKYIIYSLFLLLALIFPAIPFFKGVVLSRPIVTSLYWCTLIGIIYFFLPALYIPMKGTVSADLTGYGLSGGIIFIALQFMAGVFMKKLEASPYDISASGILLNVITIFPQIVAKEFVRQYSFATAYKTLKHRKAAIIVITVMLSLIEINFLNLVSINGIKELFIYSVRVVLPIITKNVLMSVLVYYGGIKPAIIYFGIIQLFQKCFPVLPELPWILEGAIGIVFPSIYAIFIADHAKGSYVRDRGDKKEDITFWISLFFATMFAWFCIGVFPIYPSIILTGSMEPLIFPGDAVIVRKISHENEINALSEGDIINFKRGDIIITHRIKRVIKDEAGNVSFETKGDNNIAADENIVKPNDIKGIVVKVVPKVGIPVLILKGQNEIPEGVVDK